jgi:hypothetical protein
VGVAGSSRCGGSRRARGWANPNSAIRSRLLCARGAGLCAQRYLTRLAWKVTRKTAGTEARLTHVRTGDGDRRISSPTALRALRHNCAVDMRSLVWGWSFWWRGLRGTCKAPTDLRAAKERAKGLHKERQIALTDEPHSWHNRPSKAHWRPRAEAVRCRSKSTIQLKSAEVVNPLRVSSCVTHVAFLPLQHRAMPHGHGWWHRAVNQTSQGCSGGSPVVPQRTPARPERPRALGRLYHSNSTPGPGALIY